MNLQNVGLFLSLKQMIRSANRRRLRARRKWQRSSYAEWVEQYDTYTSTVMQAFGVRARSLTNPPRLSVLMPVCQPDLAHLEAAINSVRKQVYPNWELCIADDCSPDPKVCALLEQVAQADSRIHVVLRERQGYICAASNSALQLVSGEYVGLVDQADVLPPHALLLMAETIRRFPNAGLIYSDEDKIDQDGKRASPYFKSDWDYDLFLAQNITNHLGVYKTELVRRLGGFREGYEGSPDYDLALRCIEQLDHDQIVHIPHVLYHRRLHAQGITRGSGGKTNEADATQRALADHLGRCRYHAQLIEQGAGRYRIQYALPQPAPLVTIIVPTRNQLKLLRMCIDSLLHKTDYPAFEIIIVDNGSDDPATLKYLTELGQSECIRVLRDDGPFNFSALNNRAAQQARGEYLALVNNDIEVIEPRWLGEMVSLAARPGVGAVGAKLLYPDNTVQHAGVILGVDKQDGRGGVAGPANKGLAIDDAGYGDRAALTQSFSAVTAACMVVRRSVYDEVDGLDAANLVVTYNDVDFCLRLRERGYRNLWTPHAVLYHHESISRNRDAAAPNRERFEKEAAYMRKRWAGMLKVDPAYNPNLNIKHADFALADPPRVSLDRPWFESCCASVVTGQSSG